MIRLVIFASISFFRNLEVQQPQLWVHRAEAVKANFIDSKMRVCMLPVISHLVRRRWPEERARPGTNSMKAFHSTTGDIVLLSEL